MDKNRDDSKPTQPISSPAATYRASENVPSVRTLLPPPKFPKLDTPPESSAKPATVAFDGKGLTPSSDKPVQGTIIKPQERGGFLTRPHKFDPATGKMLPVELPPVPEVQPVTSRPIHDLSRSKTSN